MALLQKGLADDTDFEGKVHMLMHGWTVMPILSEFVAKILTPLQNEGGMSVADLAKQLGTEAGPLTVALRTCVVLGFTAVEAAPGGGLYYSDPGSAVKELSKILKEGSKVGDALMSVYSHALAPFSLPSPQARLLFRVWERSRSSWKSLKTKGLALLLDGVILAPLLASLVHLLSSDSDIVQRDEDKVSLDLSAFDMGSLAILDEILDQELNLGSIDNAGIVLLKPEMVYKLERCGSFILPMSFSPVLGNMSSVLFEEPGWGFLADEDGDEPQPPFRDAARAIGGIARDSLYLAHAKKQLNATFGTDDLESQPKFVAVMDGSGDLALNIYQHVQSQTERGQALNTHKLVMVAVVPSDESSEAVISKLGEANIPHVIVKGTISDPTALDAELEAKEVVLSKTLHVRSCLDCTRQYKPPQQVIKAGSAVDQFAKAMLEDVVHLDAAGKCLSPSNIFASLLEHFGSWAKMLDGSKGLIVLEEMTLGIPTTQTYLPRNDSFHVDVINSFTRQYAVPAPVFALAAAMTGLLPKDAKNVQTQPHKEQYSNFMCQTLTKRPFNIRLAEVSDLPRLVALEELAWAEEHRGKPETLLKRLQTSPTTCFVGTIDDKVVGVLYTQRTANEDVTDGQTVFTVSETHSPTGKLVQLIAIAADPEYHNMGIGAELRAFALHLTHLDPTIEAVIAVTLARDFKTSNSSMQAYVDKHAKGDIFDPIIGFHTGFGATVRRLVHNYRPDDVDNQGIGVLIRYEISDMETLGKTPVEGADGAADDALESAAVSQTSVQIITQVMEEFGYEMDEENPMRGFFDYGIDSVETGQMRNRIGKILHMDLPITLLFDYPSTLALTEHLDKIRAPKKKKAVEPTAKKQATGATAKAGSMPMLNWEDFSLEDNIMVQTAILRKIKDPKFQRGIDAWVDYCYPDQYKFTFAISEMCDEAQGKVLNDFGLIPDTDIYTVEEGLVRLCDHTCGHFRTSNKMQDLIKEHFYALRQYEIWR